MYLLKVVCGVIASTRWDSDYLKTGHLGDGMM